MNYSDEFDIDVDELQTIIDEIGQQNAYYTTLYNNLNASKLLTIDRRNDINTINNDQTVMRRRQETIDRAAIVYRDRANRASNRAATAAATAATAATAPPSPAPGIATAYGQIYSPMPNPSDPTRYNVTGQRQRQTRATLRPRPSSPINPMSSLARNSDSDKNDDSETE